MSMVHNAKSSVNQEKMINVFLTFISSC